MSKLGRLYVPFNEGLSYIIVDGEQYTLNLISSTDGVTYYTIGVKSSSLQNGTPVFAEDQTYTI